MRTIVVFIALFAGQSVLAECPKLGGTAMGDLFGIGVAADGDNAIVGTVFGNSATGAAVPYEWTGSTWQELPMLTASDAAADDRFGQKVALSGNVAVVSAHYNDDDGVNSGAVYVFRKNGGVWSEEQKLTAFDAAANDEYGWSVAIDGDLIVVGSWFDTDTTSGIRSGSAYVYRYSGGVWTDEAKLTPSNPSTNDRFGNAVAIDGDVIVVGAYLEDETRTDAGAAYVYRYDGSAWGEEQILRVQDNSLDFLGRAVAISGDLIAASRVDLNNDASSGDVTLFRWNGVDWDQEIRITGSINHYGASIGLDGDRLLIGAPLSDGIATDAGLVYIWERDGGNWGRTRGPLSGFDSQAADEFGSAVALDGDRIFVGAPYAADPNANTGSVYTYDLAAAPEVVNLFPGASIQDAIDQICYQGEIVLAPGTYNEAIDLKGKPITLRSVDPGDPNVVATTVIDGTGFGTTTVNCSTNEGWDTVLRGLTITGGSGVGNEDRTVLYGGGMYIGAANPTIEDCTFFDNRLFSSTVPGAGGLDKVSFGGGMYISSGRGPRLNRCRFIGNVAHISDTGLVFGSGDARGAGLYVSGRAELVNCVFNGNRITSFQEAVQLGGGLYLGLGTSLVANCTFANNTASTSASIRTFVGATLFNCIIVSDLPSHAVFGGPVDYCLVTGGAGGMGNLDADPDFVDVDGPDNIPGNLDDDLRLQPCSVAVDAGSLCLVALNGVDTDLDGKARVTNGSAITSLCETEPDLDPCGIDALIDMGAYETPRAIRSADLDGDGDVDMDDFQLFQEQFTGPKP